MRFCVPEIIGRRGAGLANELHGWAKAYIASRVLGAKLLAPAWGLNPRGYRSHFGTSRLDWAYQALLKGVLPTFRLTFDDLSGTSAREFRDEVQTFAEQRRLFDRKAYVFAVGGMWGGHGMLREAFPFIRTQLLTARGTVDNLAEVARRVPPHTLRIAVHIRRGDFATPSVSPPDHGTRWNTAIPIDWYVDVCRSLQRELAVPHRFLLFTDGTDAEVEPLVRAVDPLTTAHQSYNVCSDLLLMAEADLLVTSCSSFSLWAAALSEKPYLWHEDNLVVRDGDRAMWDHGRPLFSQRARSPRGVPVGADGKVDASVMSYLEQIHARRGWGNDLVFYGGLPRPRPSESEDDPRRR
jgi:hypothetical protein